MRRASAFYQKIPPASRFNFYCRTFHVLTKCDSPTTKPWHFTHKYAKWKQHRLAFHRYQAFCPATLNAGSSVPSPDRQVTQRALLFRIDPKKDRPIQWIERPFSLHENKSISCNNEQASFNQPRPQLHERSSPPPTQSSHEQNFPQQQHLP